MNLEPIGHINSDFTQRYETPHQATLAPSSRGVITLIAGRNYEQAVIGLEGFDRVWLVYGFHLNPTPPRSPMIRPPRHPEKVGVFATRSPHRPNGLGMSCVRLDRVEGRRVYVSEIDLLDGSPLYDIKPYLPYCDAFPDAHTGWVKPAVRYAVRLRPEAEAQSRRIDAEFGARLDRYAFVQLAFHPLDDERKRISLTSTNTGVLAYHGWRIKYCVSEHERAVEVTTISHRDDAEFFRGGDDL